MAKKLNKNQTSKFVTLYREHECLWDIASKDYKNKAMRESALKKICEDMQMEGFGVEDVKNKIKSIRSTYYLELDKIKRSTTSGASGNVYEPKMKWFTELDSFIKNVVVKRKTPDNNDSTQSESENNVTAAPTICSEIESSKTKSKKNKMSRLSSIVSSAKLLQNDICRVEEEDEFDVFGKHVAKQLRKLSTEQGIVAQEEIQSVITKYRLNDLRYFND
ncbi:uncharacterized protein LOC126926324 isoform X1 [Bombus affinis]|uniref:Uncharacterized protein LOC110120029 n=2 Tax=Bombus TaxID=144708 RepID=A0A9B7D0A9_BOMTE|nr:uncharacterized protein LOC110120029 [Bombus terrestris]XP_048269707.1 uncharacterized protein LOC110120029 [Bombus terrestris]XP_050598571.1 uncharacterized protein LOC126926324 isoform X1 [Bombus affinis]XP_050598572.1 uncharacterized protein LOC126926324 isoform X1 [Bombus affinis]XP_050598573.1 uncharacterized protein LOC126926324 isoform X1 [Bombus affinis]